MTSIVWTVLAVYLALLLAVSLYAKKLTVTSTDFLLAGRKMGFIITTATLAATHYGGGFVLGGASWGAQYGLGGVWYGLACGVGLLLLGIFFAKPLRALAAFTVPEVLERRFGGKGVTVISASLSLFALVGILGAQVWASASIFEVLGFSGTTGAIIATVVFIVYTAFSGMWAVALTDFVQIIIGSAGVILAVVLSYIKVGGMTGLRASLETLSLDTHVAYFDFSSPGLPIIFLTLFATTMYTLIGQDFYQRLFSARDETVARRAAIASGVFLIIIAFVPTLAGMLSLALAVDPASILASPKTAIPQLIMIVFGSWVGAIFIAAILAAIMSTADSLLSAATTHVVKDFYQGIINRQADDRKILVLSRVWTIVIGGVALLMALQVKDIITLLLYSYDIYTAGVFVPLVLGFYWKRATRAGALAGMVCGFLPPLLGIAGVVSFAQPEYVYVSGALVSLIVMIAVSLLPSRS